MEGGTRQEYLDVLAVLRKEASIDSKLICLLCCSDKLLSHLASKSLASLVHFQLTEECPDAARVLAPGTLRILLSPLDSALEGLYKSAVLHPDALRGAPASAEATRNLSSFLDLLELLVASRTQAPLDSACQAMLFWDASGVLGLTTLPVRGFVRRKAVLLLKRGLLHRACGDLPDPQLERERLALADTVLQFVDSGGLDRVTVGGRDGHLGGHPDGPEGAAHGGPDQVMLRAVSLVLLKALEIKIQHSASAAEAQARLESVLHPLLTFVETRLGVPLFEHPCLWLSALFIEQDDDMLEAAKALLAIYVKCERSLDGGDGDPLAHRSGCNPHCVFLFLLRSVGFDASVLLDFLISSETCFLEYFVRYLKLLIKDWRHFVRTAERFQPLPNSHPSLPLESLSGPELSSCQPDSSLLTASHPLQQTPKNHFSLWHVGHQAVKPSSSDAWRGSDHEPVLGALQGLAAYESSEDSEGEGAGEERSADVEETSLRQACTAATVDVGDCAQSAGQQALLPGQKDLTLSSSCKVSLNSPGSGEGMLEKSVQCFHELQDSISRLHGKNLFPYNPTALLKLLAHIDCVSKQCSSM
ncbi:hypothetical protein lerEdw1_011112 [Lerista edwardsae]|nr:hypothetical protein lerEdw1_011112 [Lerista edwardsae]